MDTHTPSSRTRARRRIGRGVLLAVAILAGTACSPQFSIDAIFWNADAGAATRVAQCESKMNPYAVSSTNDHGLFQINAIHRAEFERVTGRPWSDVYDPFWNTAYAKYLFDRQGWGPWTCRYAA